MEDVKRMTKDNEVTMHSFVMKQIDQNDVLATSNKMPEDDFATEGLQGKLLPPPYDPFKLAVLVESSSVLNQAIDVMQVNCETFGFELVPSVDEETFKELKEEQEKTLGSSKAKDTGTKTDKPNTIETEIDREFRLLTNFFKYINRRLSYTQLRKRTRRDYELVGNAYWEILRNHVTNRITGVEWLPAHNVRIGKMDKKFTDYMAKVKISDTEIEERPDKMKFRRYAQIKESGSKPVWFKEFGDPRIMDAETGARAIAVRDTNGKITDFKAIVDSEFPEFDVPKLKAGRMKIATEILHFCNFSTSRSLPYGIPRWIGNLISIIGSRAAEEINLMYFENKTVPPGMLLVQGGKITKDTVERVTNHIKDNVKGSKNFHSILVIEATAAENVNPNLPAPAIPRLQWVSMKDSQNGDSLFQNYDKENIQKILSSFRFWHGYVGRTKEVNLATARVAKELSEEQVFQPEREEFDSIINRTLLVEMGINYWEHKTKGPKLSTPKETSEILVMLKDFLTGDEARQIASQILGKELAELGDAEGEEWTKKPLQLIIAELSKMGSEMNSPIEGETEIEEEPDVEGKTPEEAKKIMDAFKLKQQQKKVKAKSETAAKFVKKLMAVKKSLRQAEIDELNGEMGRV